MNTQKFRYKTKWWLFALIFGLFGYGSYLFYEKALNNTLGLIINGFLKLSKTQATTLYYLAFVFCIAFVLIGLIMLYLTINSKHYLQLFEDKIIVPPSTIINRQFTEIYFKNIITLEEFSGSSNSFLAIYHSKGKTNIVKAMLSKKD